MRWLLLLFLCLPAFAQTRPPVLVGSLDTLLTRKPLADGEEADVAFGYRTNDWGGIRRLKYSATSALATNIGDVFQSSNTNVPGRWIAKDRSDARKDPRWWRAIPSDGEDDTAALQALLDSGAKLIQLPPGTFNLSGAGLTMSTPAYILGSQRGASIFDYSGTADALTISSGTTDTQVIGPRVEEVTFFGRTVGGSAPRSLYRVQGATRGTIQRCSFTWDRELGYPLEGSKNIWFNEQGWIWSVKDCQIGYAESGIYMSSTNATGSIVSAIEVNGGEIFGNRYGILSGYTNLPSSTIGNGAYRLLVNIWIKGTTIEANGAYGAWFNGAEQVTIEDLYTEANGHLYHTNGTKYFTNELRSADIVLGNQFDTSTNYSVGTVKISGVRFADSTNALVAYSGREIDVANNMVVGGRGTNFVFSPNVRNVTVWENNTSASQSSGNPSVHDPGGVVAYRRKSVDAAGLPVVSQTAIPRFGDFDLSDVYWTADRAFNLQPPVAVQTISPDKPVGFMGVNWGRSGYPRSGWVNDGTNITFLSKTETAGAALPFSFDINGTEQFRVETNTARFRGNVTVHTSNQVENLSVDGSIAAGSPPIYTGALSGAPTHRISINSSNNTTETMGYVMYSKDGTYNPSAIIKLDPNVGARELAFKLNYSSGGNIPIRFYSPVKGILGEFYDPSTNWTSLRLHLNGSLQEVRWDPSGALYAGVSYSVAAHNHDASNITSGTLSAARLPVINIAASNITSGVIAPARLGSGSGSTNTWLNGQGAFTTIPTPPSPTNGITDAPADSFTYGRLNNAWKALEIADVGGLQTALDDRQTYASMLADGITAGSLTSVGTLTVYDVPLVSPGTAYTPLVQNSSGFGIKRMTTNDMLVQLGASPVGHGHAESEITNLVSDLAKAITNIVGGAGTTVGITNQVATVTASSIYSPLAFAVAVPMTVGELNKVETTLLGSARAGESKTLPAGYLTTGSILKIELIGSFSTSLANWSGGRLKVKVGGLTLQFDPVDPGSATPSGWTWTATCYVAVQAAGTSATVSATGYAMFPDNTIFTTAFTPQHVDPNVSGTLNTVGTNAVDVTWQNTDSTMGLTITLKSAIVTRY